MKLLLITDQWAGSQHSAIEGVFGGGLTGFDLTQIVEFSRDSDEPHWVGNRLVLPSSCRYRGLSASLVQFCPGMEWDFVVVRNLVPVLRQALSPQFPGARVGFWHSFPHAYRRLYEACRERRAIVRKGIEYCVRSWIERRLLRRCDFVLPITATMHEEFHKSISVPWMPLPMGVNPALVARYRSILGEVGRVRIAYCGAMDSLRSLDVVCEAVAELGDSVTLDLYGDPSAARSCGLLKGLPQGIRLMGRLSRDELFRALTGYDVGISPIPDDRLFRVSSPTKSMEYAALGLVPILTPIPEHLNIFDATSAVFCSMNRYSISNALASVASMSPEERANMAMRARSRVMQLRSYPAFAARLSEFLLRLL